MAKCADLQARRKNMSMADLFDINQTAVKKFNEEERNLSLQNPMLIELFEQLISASKAEAKPINKERSFTFITAADEPQEDDSRCGTLVALVALVACICMV
ncbi:MAG TPA: hypothetical protein VN457_08015 [Chlamydiales bacterium]|nr:hypothetical protein [Chlamydiales bacterium]